MDFYNSAGNFRAFPEKSFRDWTANIKLLIIDTENSLWLHYVDF